MINFQKKKEVCFQMLDGAIPTPFIEISEIDQI